MTSVFMRVEGLDCFNQKPSSIVTSVFFITNRPLGAQFILDECIALLATVVSVVTWADSEAADRNLGIAMIFTPLDI